MDKLPDSLSDIDVTFPYTPKMDAIFKRGNTKIRSLMESAKADYERRQEEALRDFPTVNGKRDPREILACREANEMRDAVLVKADEIASAAWAEVAKLCGITDLEAFHASGKALEYDPEAKLIRVHESRVPQDDLMRLLGL